MTEIARKEMFVRRTNSWALPLAVFAGALAAGSGLAVLGGMLRASLCFGGGSECRSVEPIWETGGTILEFVGGVLFFGSPVAAGLVAWRLRVGRSNERTMEDTK